VADMFLLSILIWGISILSLRFCVAGNPAYAYVQNTPDSIRQMAVKCLKTQDIPENTELVFFLNRFSKLAIFSVVVFVVEMLVLFILLYKGHANVIVAALLMKNSIILAVNFHLQKKGNDNIIENIMDIPGWAVRLEKFSNFLTAAGFILLYVTLFNSDLLSLFSSQSQ
jgi:hypothetical protein